MARLTDLARSIQSLAAPGPLEPTSHGAPSPATPVPAPNPAQLDELLRRGWVCRDQKGALRASGRFIEGRLSFTHGGSAFVDAATEGESAFIPPGATHTAFQGDDVRVWLPPATATTGGGRLAEGMVVDILRRQRDTLTAQVRRDAAGAVAMALDTRIRARIRLPAAAARLVGSWVRVHLDPWTDPAQEPTGQVDEVLGRDEDPATDERLVLAEYNLPPAFPAPVEAEAARLRITPADLAGRLDLRDRFVLTIDPADSKDFDDALSVRRLHADLWELAVHVADVGQFVTPGSALDSEAARRGCSTYLPARVIPMLPESLANDLCSLKPEVDRLAFTALIQVHTDGRIEGARFAPSIIRSRRRLAYEQAFAALAGPADQASRDTGLDAETVGTIRTLAAVAQALGQRRHADGALELSSAEIKLTLGADGKLTAMTPVYQDAAHRLVEECMLAANEYACRTLATAGVAQLHRVHPEPEYARIGVACANLVQAGVTAEPPVCRASLARLLTGISERADAAVWTATVLRALPRAEYAVDTQGHFGLAKTHYAHFTSPIRRYPDLVTHRLLKDLGAGRAASLSAAALGRIAATSSDCERTSQRAERHLSETKRLRWLADAARRQPSQSLEAVVTAVCERGADVYLPGCGLFGWLPRARSAAELTPGQHLQVNAARLDPARRELELMPAPGGALRATVDAGLNHEPATPAAAALQDAPAGVPRLAAGVIRAAPRSGARRRSGGRRARSSAGR
jgi:ribonuclease R